MHNTCKEEYKECRVKEDSGWFERKYFADIYS